MHYILVSTISFFQGDLIVGPRVDSISILPLILTGRTSNYEVRSALGTSVLWLLGDVAIRSSRTECAK